jgi:hypothetical protein
VLAPNYLLMTWDRVSVTRGVTVLQRHDGAFILFPLVSTIALFSLIPQLHGYNPEGVLNSFESHGKPSRPVHPLERHLIVSPFLIGSISPLMALINPLLLIFDP